MFLIIQREFLERARKKSFIITTLIMPIFMIGMMVAPSLVMLYGKGERKQVVVVDKSGYISANLTTTDEVEFILRDSLTKADACRTYGPDSDIFAILYIDTLPERPSGVQLITNSSSSPILEENISMQVSQIVQRQKLQQFQSENLDQILAALATQVELHTFINNGTGDETTMESTSSGINYILGILLGMMLYMIIIVYGQMVLTSVVEEKSSRVMDMMLTSCTPLQIMMGKIIGVALVAITQLLIWGVLLLAASKFLVPAIFSADVVSTSDMMFQSLVGTIGDTAYIAEILAYMLLFMLGGFLLYASLYAASGSAVDSVQDGQQFNTIIMMPIILSIIVMMSVFNDPNSPIAFWSSIFPFTAPIVMIARIPFDIPLWEIILSLVLLYTTFIVTAWCAAKIYRVGVFQHGKRPSWRELWQWLRTK